VSIEIILEDVARYYSDRLSRFGATPAGVDWRDETSQTTRFAQLLKVVEDPAASVIDFGCGFGALLPYMRERGYAGPYRGMDLAPAMLAAARQHCAVDPNCVFELGATPSAPADYAVASGIFNVRLTHTDLQWRNYVEGTIETMNRSARRGFAFNCLTSYSDPGHHRPDLFYANPCTYFELCQGRYARNVALLHDYGLFEFTVIVRKA
jgi:SAM-dependent methyltransferase